MDPAEDWIEVRPARAGDGAAIGRAHVASWRAAYRGILAEATLAALDPVERAAVWENAIAQGEGSLPGRCWVAELRRGVGAEPGLPGLMGFAFAGPSGDGAPHEGELCALYTDPAHWRRGAATHLYEAVRGQLAAAGFRDLVLWVLEDNARARAFYESRGLRTDGGFKPWTPRGPAHRALPLVRYRGKLR